MGSDGNALELEKLSLGQASGTSQTLGQSPVSSIEDTRRENLQKSLSNFNHAFLGKESELQKRVPAARFVEETPSAKPAPQRILTNENSLAREEEKQLTGWAGMTSGFRNFGSALKKIFSAETANSVAAGGKALVTAAGEALAYVVQNPGQVLKMGLRAASAAIDGAVSMARLVVSNPAKSFDTVVYFALGMAENLGIADIIRGGAHLLSAAGALCVLDFKGAGSHLVKSSLAVCGAVKAVGGITGITDLGRALICLSRGETGKAALYASVGGVQLYITCLTLGIGNILSRPGIEAAKKGIRHLAQDAAKEVVGTMEQRIAGAVLETVGRKTAVTSHEIVMKHWAEVAADMFNAVKGIVKNEAGKAMKLLLNEYGAKEVVANSTESLLMKIYKASAGDLASMFAKSGTAMNEAAFMAKSLKTALWKKGYSSRYHGMLAEEIIDIITGQLRDNLLERGLRKGFDEQWINSCLQIVQAKGLSPHSFEILRDAGMEGFYLGVDDGVRSVVTAGVQEAFERFRKRENLEKKKKKWEPKPYLIEAENAEYKIELAEKELAKRAPERKKRRFAKVRKDTPIKSYSTGETIKKSNEEEEFFKNKYIDA